MVVGLFGGDMGRHVVVRPVEEQAEALSLVSGWLASLGHFECPVVHAASSLSSAEEVLRFLMNEGPQEICADLVGPLSDLPGGGDQQWAPFSFMIRWPWLTSSLFPTSVVSAAATAPWGRPRIGIQPAGVLWAGLIRQPGKGLLAVAETALTVSRDHPVVELRANSRAPELLPALKAP